MVEPGVRLDPASDRADAGEDPACARDVAVEQPNHTHHKGNPYRCRIDVTVRPRHELVADEKQMDNGSHEPLNKVIHDAFKTMERQLRHLVEKQRRE